MPRTPPKNVVVITGASSAVGQALALEFAVRGDAVVMSANSDELLEAPKRACEMLGAWTHGVVVPERNERAMRAMAQSAIDRFGRIDIWVNHAAPFERVAATDDAAAVAAEIAMFDQGARTALVVFKAQGRGVLVNIDGYANMSAVSESSRAAVRTQFASIEANASTLPGVTAHSIIAAPGTAWLELAKRVVELARGAARGDVLGRAVALLTRQQMRLSSGTKKARRKLARDDEAHTAVLAGMGNGPTRGRTGSASENTRRRGGWHLAHTSDSTERTSALMALVALPLVMAAVMLMLVKG